MKRPVVITLLIVALVLVCAGIGAVALFTLRGAGTSFNMGNLSSATLEESKTIKIDAEKPVTLKVINGAGEVTVIGADVDEIQSKVVKTANAPSQARADEELKNIKYEIKQVGNTVTFVYEIPKINSNMPNVNITSPNWETVDFIITVPNDTTVEIDSGMGRANVSGLQGHVTIDNDFGDVAVEKVDGALEVKTNSGQVDVTSVKAGSEDIDIFSGFGTIHLKQVSGAGITVQSNSGAIEAEDVRATKQLELTSDFGNVTFEKGSAASLNVTTKSGSIDLTSVNVSGALTIKDDFGDIAFEQVKARSYDADTNSGSIFVNGAQGPIKAHTGFGNITVKDAEAAVLDLNTQSGSIDFEGSLGEGDHTVHSDFGEIKIAIPADTAVNVDFNTEFGNIRSELPVTFTLSGDLSESKQAGTINGGGSQFNVSTRSGNITISILSE